MTHDDYRNRVRLSAYDVRSSDHRAFDLCDHAARETKGAAIKSAFPWLKTPAPQSASHVSPACADCGVGTNVTPMRRRRKA